MLGPEQMKLPPVVRPRRNPWSFARWALACACFTAAVLLDRIGHAATPDDWRKRYGDPSDEEIRRGILAELATRKESSTVTGERS